MAGIYGLHSVQSLIGTVNLSSPCFCVFMETGIFDGKTRQKSSGDTLHQTLSPTEQLGGFERKLTFSPIAVSIDSVYTGVLGA